MALKFYTDTSVAKGLKLKGRKFWRLISTFVEVTGERLVWWAFLPSPLPPPFPSSWIGLNRGIKLNPFLINMFLGATILIVRISIKTVWKKGHIPMLAYRELFVFLYLLSKQNKVWLKRKTNKVPFQLSLLNATISSLALSQGQVGKYFRDKSYLIHLLLNKAKIITKQVLYYKKNHSLYHGSWSGLKIKKNGGKILISNWSSLCNCELLKQ